MIIVINGMIFTRRNSGYIKYWSSETSCFGGIEWKPMRGKIDKFYIWIIAN